MTHTLRFCTLLSLILAPGPAQAAGVIIAAGGGSEGAVGDTTSWSYKLYKKFIENGDKTGDGKVSVAILSTSTQDSWLPSYFVWIGQTLGVTVNAFNVTVATRADANNTTIVDPVKTADVVFLKGGDQGAYYDAWNGTTLETNIRAVDSRRGAIGGTSAGAMSLSQYCFAGGQDLVSLDVLQDAQTPYLNDTDGGSGIHTDFLGFVGSSLIDTHYTTRARMGRTLGILAKAIQDSSNTNVLAIGIEERTGIALTGTRAEVIGVGSIDFMLQTSSSMVKRDAKHPLFFTNVRLDRLTEGWRYDISSRTVDTTNRPTSATAVVYSGDSAANSGSVTIRGNQFSDEDKFT